MDQSKMEDFIANAALLAAHLTQQCEKSMADQQASAQDIRQSANEVRRTLAAGQLELTQHIRAVIRDTLADEIPIVTRSLSETSERLKAMADYLRSEQVSVGLRMRILSWKLLASLCVASMLTIAITGYFAWHNVKRAERVKVDAEVLEALQKITITSCSGTPCIKLEEGLQRWPKNDEYVLIETAPHPETSSR